MLEQSGKDHPFPPPQGTTQNRCMVLGYNIFRQTIIWEPEQGFSDRILGSVFCDTPSPAGQGEPGKEPDLTALLILIIFFTAGLFSMIGLGGGIIYVPILSWYGLDFKSGAIPLSLLLVTTTGMTAAYTYFRARLVHLRIGSAAIVTAFIGAPAGAYSLRYIPTGIVQILFAGVALYASLRILGSREPEGDRDIDRKLAAMGALFIGFFSGFSSGLLGVSGALFFLPFLLAIGYPTKEAVATSTILVTFSGLAAFLTHLQWATFDPTLAIFLTLGVIAGSRLGGLWTLRRAKPQTLRRIVGVIILIVSVKIALEGILQVLSGHP